MKIHLYIFCTFLFLSINVHGQYKHMLDVMYQFDDTTGDVNKFGMGLTYSLVQRNSMLSYSLGVFKTNSSGSDDGINYLYDVQEVKLGLGVRILPDNINSPVITPQIGLGSAYYRVEGQYLNDLKIDYKNVFSFGTGVKLDIPYKRLYLTTSADYNFFINDIRFYAGIGVRLGSERESQSISNRISKENQSITLQEKVIQTPKTLYSVALIIGNSNYKGGLSLGKVPLNDARLMEKKLKDIGYKTITLIDAKRDDMTSIIDSLKKNGSDIESMLFYYSGHGLNIDGSYCLVPVNVEISEYIDSEYCVELSSIFRTMSKLNTKLNITVIDACRDNINQEGTNIINANEYNLSNSLVYYAVPQKSSIKLSYGNTTSKFTGAFVDNIKPNIEINTFNRNLSNTMYEIDKSSLPEISGVLINGINFYFQYE